MLNCPTCLQQIPADAQFPFLCECGSCVELNISVQLPSVEPYSTPSPSGIAPPRSIESHFEFVEHLTPTEVKRIRFCSFGGQLFGLSTIGFVAVICFFALILLYRTIMEWEYYGQATDFFWFLALVSMAGLVISHLILIFTPARSRSKLLFVAAMALLLAAALIPPAIPLGARPELTILLEAFGGGLFASIALTLHLTGWRRIAEFVRAEQAEELFRHARVLSCISISLMLMSEVLFRYLNVKGAVRITALSLAMFSTCFWVLQYLVGIYNCRKTLSGTR